MSSDENKNILRSNTCQQLQRTCEPHDNKSNPQEHRTNKLEENSNTATPSKKLFQKTFQAHCNSALITQIRGETRSVKTAHEKSRSTPISGLMLVTH